MAKIKYFQVKDGAQKENLKPKKIVVSVLLALAVVFALTVLVSFIILSGKLGMELIPILAGIIFYLGAILAGFISSHGRKTRGWASGLVSGAVYSCLMYIIGALISESFRFSFAQILNIILGMLAGIIGGIIGINKKKRR